MKMVHEYITRMIKDLEEQQNKNQREANEMLTANSEIQRIINELRTLK